MQTKTTPQAIARIHNKGIEFRQRMTELYGDTYDFAKSEYLGCNKKLTFLCPIHGEVTANPDTLYRGYGCKLCNKIKNTDKSRDTTDSFIAKAKAVHGDKFDYSKVKYVDSRTKVTIICHEHGEFSILPYGHIKSHTGCTKCGSKQSHVSQRADFLKVLPKFKAIHNNKFDYLEVNYISMHTHVIVTCNTCGFKFEVTPNNNIKRDCPGCCEYGGFNPKQPGILYYIKVITLNNTYYKIGITNRSVERRFGSDMQYITVLHQVHYLHGQDAYNEEQRILKEFKEFRYKGPNVLQSGNTELFTVDILNLNPQ